jgi:hypothetical protein
LKIIYFPYNIQPTVGAALKLCKLPNLNVFIALRCGEKMGLGPDFIPVGQDRQDGVVRKQSEALRIPLGFAHPRQLA